ncbi:MAG: hypothetical protein ACRCV6_03180 [Formosimonas sp.]
MNLKALILTLLTVCSTASAQPVLNADDLRGLTQPARTVLQRYETCLHFAGEFSGDAHLDQYAHRRTKTLRCDTIDHDVAQLRRRSLNQPKIIRALGKIERVYDMSR